MFTLKRLSVEGFRGFREAEEFNFDQPATLLFGDNRSAKSSTLNAIEWALFGDACGGKQTGIRERVGWIVPNQHVPAPSARVQLELEGPGGAYSIIRIVRRSPRKSALEETLELTLPDETTLAGEPAREKLKGLLQSSFRDFLTTVYQHQEAIRAVLTQEPKDRNDAIDRLLGLSDQRNFLSALDRVDLRGRQREIAKDFTAFEELIQAGLAARENDLVALRQEAKQAGLARNQLNGNAALVAAGKTADSLRAFASETELDLPELTVPDEWTGLAEFEKSTRKAISQLRSQVPGIEEQKKLIKRQQQLLTAKTAWESLRKRWTDLGAQRRDMDKEHDGRKAVDAKITDATEKLEAEQEQLRQSNGRAAVVHEAVGFLDGLGDSEPPCPVCETVVPNLAATLKDLWTSKLKSLVEHVTAKIDSIKAQLKELRGIDAKYQKLSDEGELLEKEQSSILVTTAELLAVQIRDDDDPLAMVVAEQDQLGARLHQLGQAIQGRQERLDAVEGDLDLVRLIRDYLQHEKKKQVLETIQQSTAFKKLEGTRDLIAKLVEDTEAIKNAVAKVARNEAENRLLAAGETIDDYFRRLSRNPAVQQLKLTIIADKRTRRNSYDITDQDGNDLTPILSQGDLNALALSIFLGLAATAKESSRFRFLMLDDPSQSLGTEHKKQLAKLLDHVAQHKTLVLATMDAEFHECMRVGLTKARKEYRFGTWTPDEGPSITTFDTDGGNTGRSGRSAKPRAERIGS